MKQALHIYIGIILGVLILTACDKDSNLISEPQVTATPVEKLVITYMMAENNLSSNATTDLEEMDQAATNIPADSRLVVFIDDNDNPRIYEYHDGKRHTLESFAQDFCSTDSARVENILRTILQRFPPKECGLILWSHGSNWIPYHSTPWINAPASRSIGQDYGTNARPSVYGELNIITLKHILANLQKHWEFIYFDACFMQGIETAYELKDAADYLMGSPAEMPGDGAPYDKLIPELFKRPVQPEALLDCVWQHYKQPYHGVLLSAIKSDELKALATATAPHIAQIFAEKKDADINGVQSYSSLLTIRTPEFYDMNSFMFKHLTPEDYAAWVVHFERAVPVRKQAFSWTSDLSNFSPILIDELHYGGMSMFVPQTHFDNRNSWNIDFQHTAWYRDAGWADTGW